ncbi:SIT4 phosphatase-associated family protein [Artemisia annua]|uniref:SIT4 phosphatase-associated family protein n=1 Tax=Artemisia annua TaxID=35608 RepID=A0A2U1LRM2_ARTAN|nr:SIT4 phosphatase-associated family protein [Artemisia annua]
MNHGSHIHKQRKKVKVKAHLLFKIHQMLRDGVPNREYASFIYPISNRSFCICNGSFMLHPTSSFKDCCDLKYGFDVKVLLDVGHVCEVENGFQSQWLSNVCKAQQFMQSVQKAANVVKVETGAEEWWESYSPFKDTRSSLNSMQFVKKYASVAVLNGQLYHFGGEGFHTGNLNNSSLQRISGFKDHPYVGKTYILLELQLRTDSVSLVVLMDAIAPQRCRYNNALHYHIESMIYSCLESRNNTIIDHLFKGCGLLSKILQTYSNPVLSREHNEEDVFDNVIQRVIQVKNSFLFDAHTWTTNCHSRHTSIIQIRDYRNVEPGCSWILDEYILLFID